MTFDHPFLLDEIEQELPAGDYTVETQEERIEGDTFLAHRIVSTVLVFRPPNSKRKDLLFWEISAESLASALARDMRTTQENLTNNSIYNLTNEIGSPYD